ncbi:MULTISPECIES: hypothetical protein [unclassified Variovorax]|uniref:hypothetical protein n=1 Tax=unclassified Variovorax TaxID=663243 RepID=UPI00076DE326|nr:MULTISPECIES: hypothetical protein [unclassified Variovorax]KWT65059.1 hypothetical protein APY03_7512 [Variovorax sp. WDL1]PNG49068.1 hypothetical protein CHC06_06305 [Variovorax sp. B2]PNG49453.1 hypothetical protein CHC07_06362 [Variovorax sp. B4]VTV18924.1 hypothetical protein WDL1P2_00535 [Variovorax sp. WDL1]
MTAATNYRTRKLFQIRIHRPGHTFGVQVGHKCRLLPRASAARVARRLREAGHCVTIDPILVKLTREQVFYLAKRYPLAM